MNFLITEDAAAHESLKIRAIYKLEEKVHLRLERE